MKKLLACMPHAKAHVIEEPDRRRTLISYETRVAEISPDNWLTVYGLYSPTTKRHIVAFMDEYIHGIKSKEDQIRSNTGSYQTMKALFEGAMKMNILTGEITDI